MKKKTIVSIILSSFLCLFSVMPVFAIEINEPTMTQEELDNATPAEEEPSEGSFIMPRASNSNYLTIPSGKGKITSNAWRSSSPTTSGNTYQWNYQVSAVYSGSKTVSSIRTTWKGSASLRNSASINLGVSASGVSAGASASWQNVSTVTKYWENTNGSKEASYRSNMVVSPKTDYREDTISIVSTASVKLSGDAKSYQITASC